MVSIEDALPAGLTRAAGYPNFSSASTSNAPQPTIPASVTTATRFTGPRGDDVPVGVFAGQPDRFVLHGMSLAVCRHQLRGSGRGVR